GGADRGGAPPRGETSMRSLTASSLGPAPAASPRGLRTGGRRAAHVGAASYPTTARATNRVRAERRGGASPTRVESRFDRAGLDPRGATTVGDQATRIVIVGIGDDGLAGLTEAARRTVLEADVLLGAPATLRLLGEDAPGRRVAL